MRLQRLSLVQHAQMPGTILKVYSAGDLLRRAVGHGIAAFLNCWAVDAEEEADQLVQRGSAALAATGGQLGEEEEGEREAFALLRAIRALLQADRRCDPGISSHLLAEYSVDRN